MIHFGQYFKTLQSYAISEITEKTHRKELHQLLEAIAKDVDPKITIQHEPKREGRFGAPDFKISKAESIIGYVENKKIEENLDRILKSDQIKKYQQLNRNILLTNYIEWLWLKPEGGPKRETLCYLTDIENRRSKLDPAKAQAVEKLIQNFFSQPPKGIGTVPKLAEALAVRGRHLREFLAEELQRQEKEHTEGRLYGLYQTFKNHVFSELTVPEFADAFSQNLIYGLFLAKLNADAQTVTLFNAKQFIPRSFELIKELVDFLDVLDRDEYRDTRWIVEETLTIMNHLNLGEIQKSLSFKRGRKTDTEEAATKDPYVYFYEDFLKAYDKKLRKSKGVYYTPPPVVNFIVRAIDDILVNTFGIKDGLADHHRVTVLDFACGTGTFILEILKIIFDKLPPGSGKRDLIIKEHILKNIYGFEYLIAPYTIAHLKLSQFLKDEGYTLSPKERFQIYLTNTLEPSPAQMAHALLPALAHETQAAQKVKDNPILVITGNPPYSYVSKNNGEWIQSKIRDYYLVDGEKLKERNPKGLQDDYVKFIRFAQWKMEQVEEGVVGIITNHSFLDNPTFRGMRQSLMNTFDQMYFLDLHGSIIKQEKTPDNSKDENVFDIEPGVSISLLIKNTNRKDKQECKVHYCDFWGLRKEKEILCLNSEINSIEWIPVSPSTPYYFFKKGYEVSAQKYNNYISVENIFKSHDMGITTHRDGFVIDIEHSNLHDKIQELKRTKSKKFHIDPLIIDTFSIMIY